MIDEEVNKLLYVSNNLIGKYTGILISFINPMLLISPILIQETIDSSKLEGTHATLEDLLNYQIGNNFEGKEDDIKEVYNYRKALIYANEKLGTINDAEKQKAPLSSKIIKEIHKILLNNVRGKTKDPGNFKRNQNFIGSIDGVSFVPVSPQLTEEYMTNLEEYIHSEEMDIIYQSAIIHAQFEMIHPFEDGNGRIGRLLIPLFLYYKELLPVPAFYMSNYFNKNRSEYLQRLENISKNNDWKGWIKFYLNGVIESANNNLNRAGYLKSFYDEVKEKVLPKLNSKHGIMLLDLIFDSPFLTSKYVAEKLKVSKPTAFKLLDKLVKEKVLTYQIDGQKRIYYCKNLLV